MMKIRFAASAAALAFTVAGCGEVMERIEDAAQQEDAADAEDMHTSQPELSDEDATALASNAERAAAQQIDFGNDQSEYANDGECDDVRFQGSAMASVQNTDHIGRDATDCQTAFEAGNVELNPLYAEPASVADIVYGDDTARFANDGECDDIRFTGDYATQLVYQPQDIGHDASDCRAAVESGDAVWQGATATPEYGITLDEIEAQDY